MNHTRIKRYKRKKIYSAYCFDMVVDEVLWPTEKRLKRDLIVHDGISVMLPLLDARHMILLKQYRYGPDRVLWELPAGTIARKESPLTCAKREIEEEIGYRARRWRKLASIYASPGFSTEIIHCFTASDLKKTATRLEHDEVLEPHVRTLSEVKKMVKDRVIRDAKTLMALFYFFQDGKNR